MGRPSTPETAVVGLHYLNWEGRVSANCRFRVLDYLRLSKDGRLVTHYVDRRRLGLEFEFVNSWKIIHKFYKIRISFFVEVMRGLVGGKGSSALTLEYSFRLTQFSV